MANITAAEVQAAGRWTAVEAPDVTLALAPFIPAGDGWLNKIIVNNSYASLAALTLADANAGAMAKAAECYYVAYLFASAPPKEDFTAGPVKIVSQKGVSIKTSADHLLQTAKDLLEDAGLKTESWDWSYKGGDSYHPNSDDPTQIHFGEAENTPFNTTG